MELLLFPIIKHATIIITLLYASYVDLKTKHIDNRWIYAPLLIFGFSSFLYLPWWIIIPSILFAWLFAHVLYHFGKLGGADVRVFTLLGACYPGSVILIIFYSGMAACLFGIFLIWKMGLKTASMMKFPYIPFITLGTIAHTWLFVFGI